MDTAESATLGTPDGPAWAAVLASGIGCVTLGLAVDLTAASKLASAWLVLYRPVGDLSGKALLAVVAWLGSWALLHARYRDRRVRSANWIFAATLVLLALAMVAVFPPFFGLFAAR
jgi:hypothetical protein